MGRKIHWLSETVLEYEVVEVLGVFSVAERVDQQMSVKLKSPSIIVLGMVKIDSKYFQKFNTVFRGGVWWDINNINQV